MVFNRRAIVEDVCEARSHATAIAQYRTLSRTHRPDSTLQRSSAPFCWVIIKWVTNLSLHFCLCFVIVHTIRLDPISCVACVRCCALCAAAIIHHHSPCDTLVVRTLETNAYRYEIQHIVRLFRRSNEQKNMCDLPFTVRNRWGDLWRCRTLIKYHKQHESTWCIVDTSAVQPVVALQQSTMSCSSDCRRLRLPLTRQLDNIMAFTFINQSHLLRQTHSALVRSCVSSISYYHRIHYRGSVAKLPITHIGEYGAHVFESIRAAVLKFHSMFVCPSVWPSIFYLRENLKPASNYVRKC